MRPHKNLTIAAGLIFLAVSCLTSSVAQADPGLNRGLSGSGQFWASAEFLYWQTSGMEIPALVTGNPEGTPISDAGIIGAPTTRILLGNETILDGHRPGYRFTAGTWLTCNVGMEVDYFGLSNETASYRYGENSNLVIGRPIINLAPLPAGSDPRYDTQLVVFDNLVTGSLRVSASSELYGYGARMVFDPLRNCCSQCLTCATCSRCDGVGACDGGFEPGCGLESSCDGGCRGGCSAPRCNDCNFTFSVGYRHLQLNEGLQISEELSSATERFDLYDRFRTESSFDGLEVGVDWACQYLCFYLDAFGRFAVGMNDNDVSIRGQTTDLSGGTPAGQPGGLLTQSTNIGNYNQNVASLMIQLGLNGSCHIGNGLSLTAGYSVLYWGNVAQAGDQIGLAIHPDLIPPVTAPLGTVGALPTNRLSDMVAHGINLGAIYVF